MKGKGEIILMRPSDPVKLQTRKPSTHSFTTNLSSIHLMDDAKNSAFEMASESKFSYRRLRNEEEFENEAEEIRAFRNIRKWSRFRKLSFKKRPKLKIPALRRFLRKRSKFFSRVKVSWSKALKRLKNGQAHINDLFGGNFLLMQANPTLRCGERRRPSVGYGHHGLPSSYSHGKIA